MGATVCCVCGSPSGTENVVRVYAEAETVAMADKLAAHVACAVYKIANGTGDEPTVEGLVAKFQA